MSQQLDTARRTAHYLKQQELVDRDWLGCCYQKMEAACSSETHLNN
jgi:hypothetical protein